MKKISYVVKSKLGLHARPAGLLARLAGNYQSTITVNHKEQECDAKRIIGLMRMNVKQAETICIAIEGADEEAAAVEIQKFLEENL